MLYKQNRFRLDHVCHRPSEFFSEYSKTSHMKTLNLQVVDDFSLLYNPVLLTTTQQVLP